MKPWLIINNGSYMLKLLMLVPDLSVPLSLSLLLNESDALYVYLCYPKIMIYH